ncbi:ubiquinone anaerobic biosynthesis accessory factor UbiT [Pleionea sediminis]|uniref:ubiquinone anaerobic biosynthesis accessory factor UbiT n=1 Tax=Pleionea sediminis TaxID=2569479 RepID=UPI0013DE38CE|nr:SCP2 sterol-binding domain-containing protein [Pleionea sediminis]
MKSSIQQLALVGINLGNKVPLSLRNLVLKPISSRIHRAINRETLTQIRGKKVTLEVIDLENIFCFVVQDKTIELIDGISKPDVTFRGTSNALISLLLQKEDPDALFFTRQLTILGNTELGLEIKSIFDNINIDQLPGIISYGLEKLYSITQQPVHIKREPSSRTNPDP